MGLMNCDVQDICLPLEENGSQFFFFVSTLACPDGSVPLWMETIQRSLCICAHVPVCVSKTEEAVINDRHCFVALSVTLLRQRGCLLSFILNPVIIWYFFKLEINRNQLIGISVAIVSDGLDKVEGSPV